MTGEARLKDGSCTDGRVWTYSARQRKMSRMHSVKIVAIHCSPSAFAKRYNCGLSSTLLNANEAIARAPTLIVWTTSNSTPASSHNVVMLLFWGDVVCACTGFKFSRRERSAPSWGKISDQLCGQLNEGIEYLVLLYTTLLALQTGLPTSPTPGSSMLPYRQRLRSTGS